MDFYFATAFRKGATHRDIVEGPFPTFELAAKNVESFYIGGEDDEVVLTNLNGTWYVVMPRNKDGILMVIEEDGPRSQCYPITNIINNEQQKGNEKPYPVVIRTFSIFDRLKGDEHSTVLLRCPFCNEQLPVHKLHAKNIANYCVLCKGANDNDFVGEPTYCEKCGKLIYPLS